MADVKIFLVHTDHLSGLFGPANDSREPSFGSIIPSNTHFDESASIVDHNRRVLIHVYVYFFKTYFIISEFQFIN